MNIFDTAAAFAREKERFRLGRLATADSTDAGNAVVGLARGGVAGAGARSIRHRPMR